MVFTITFISLMADQLKIYVAVLQPEQFKVHARMPVFVKQLINLCCSVAPSL